MKGVSWMERCLDNSVDRLWLLSMGRLDGSK